MSSNQPDTQPDTTTAVNIPDSMDKAATTAANSLTEIREEFNKIRTQFTANNTSATKTGLTGILASLTALSTKIDTVTSEYTRTFMEMEEKLTIAGETLDKENKINNQNNLVTKESKLQTIIKKIKENEVEMTGLKTNITSLLNTIGKKISSVS